MSDHEWKRIEDYNPGYPQYTALIAAHEPYYISRRFGRLRARLLLQKQDKLSMLEEKLDKIDANESTHLFLGSSRDDTNLQRHEVLKEIDTAMADYDEFVRRNREVMGLSKPADRDVTSLHNWLNATGNISWAESDYLNHRDDLVSVSPVGSDAASNQLEVWVEDIIISYCKLLHNKIRMHSITTNKRIFFFSHGIIRNLAKGLMLTLVVTMLVAPVVFCNFLKSNSARIGIIIGFLVTLLILLSVLFRPKTVEMLIIGATYATVITVFVQNA